MNSLKDKFYNKIIALQNSFEKYNINRKIIKLKTSMLNEGIINHLEDLNIKSLPIIQKHNESIFKIGKNCTLLNTSEENIAGISSACVLATVTPKAKLIIGNYVGISGAYICSTNSIKIGDYVNIGVGAKIYDTDFHPINYRERRKNPGFDLNKIQHAPIFIEDDVWIGANAIILKGVTIGKKSIIAAGSVVTRDIPANTIAAGNPARVIKSI